ncbi:MAG: glycosyltransferase [Anaerolineaceae bacterium]|nr:glycosyltransferase [Anaerolineaceae bacterium]
MKVLISSTYFEPYSSGLSQYALRLGRGLLALGHEVTVLTSQYRKDLRLEAEAEGIHIVRVPVSFHLSKGVVMLGLEKLARQWIKWADVVNLHLPQFESAFLAGLTKTLKKRLVVTYHCDLEKNGSFLAQAPYLGARLMNRIALEKADAIAQSSRDYAESSPALQDYMNKVSIIVPPIDCRQALRKEIKALRETFALDENHQYIGLSGRVATEKGYETLSEALPLISQDFPRAMVLHAGSWKGVVGEEPYQQKIDQLIMPQEKQWKKLGFLSDESFRAFFALCDVLVVSSTNRTEAFGMVQIESFAQGTAVVASDSPGIRVPVTQTGAGALFTPADAVSLAEAVKNVLKKGKSAFKIDPDYLQGFSEKAVAIKYLEIFKK